MIKQLDRPILLAITITIFWLSCHIDDHEVVFGCSAPIQFKESLDLNENNNDNKIFKSKRTFTYIFTFINTQGEQVLPVVYFNRSCIGNSDIDCIGWKTVSMKSQIEDEFSIDSLKLYVFESRGNSNLANNQTIIKYDYINKKNGVIGFGEKTGIVEDSSLLFVHPPRMYSFTLLEFSPFPRVSFPLEIGAEWSTSMVVPQNEWTRFVSFSQETEDYVYVDCKYTVDDIISSLVNDSHHYSQIYKIKGECESSLGISSAEFLFSPLDGFIKAEYDNVDGSCLSLILEDQ